jgi:hypothetical protein
MGFVRRVTGKDAAGAATAAGELQQKTAVEQAGELGLARDRSLGLFDPFQQAGQAGVEQAGFLTDPQAQVDFLQGNPLFELMLQNANTETGRVAASRGRLGAGDTAQDFASNVLLQGMPLIQQQKQSIGDLINLGSGVAGQQANIDIGGTASMADLITGGSAAQAAGKVGAANARQAGATGLLNLGAGIGTSFLTGGVL